MHHRVTSNRASEREVERGKGNAGELSNVLMRIEWRTGAQQGNPAPPRHGVLRTVHV